MGYLLILTRQPGKPLHDLPFPTAGADQKHTVCFSSLSKGQSIQAGIPIRAEDSTAVSLTESKWDRTQYLRYAKTLVGHWQG